MRFIIVSSFLCICGTLFSCSSGNNTNTLMAEQSQSNPHEIFLSENSHNGKILTLSDGSSWEVAPQDLNISEVWVIPSPFAVEKSANATFPYYLVNKDTGSKVLVRPIAPEKKESEKSQKPIM